MGWVVDMVECDEVLQADVSTAVAAAEAPAPVRSAACTVFWPLKVSFIEIWFVVCMTANKSQQSVIQKKASHGPVTDDWLRVCLCPGK